MAELHPVYLVLEPDVIVAADLAEAVAARDPAAEVHVVYDVAGAQRELDLLPPLRAAVLNASVDELRSGGLASRIDEMGAAIVVLHAEEAEDAAGDGWSFVRRPFSSDAVAQALDSLLAEVAPAGA